MNTENPRENGPDPAPLDPKALSPAALARVLSAAGGEGLGPEQIAADLAAGCPANPDGSLNLLHYSAWLAREAAGGRRA